MTETLTSETRNRTPTADSSNIGAAGSEIAIQPSESQTPLLDQTIICFASNYFFDPTSKHHVMRELSKSRHVLWINWHASRRPSLNGRDLKGIWHKLKQIGRGVKKVHERLWVMTPFVLPLPSSAIARRLNKLFVSVQLRWVLRKLPADRQLWSFTPDMSNLFGTFGENLRVYYCVDEFSAFPGYDDETITALDRQMCEKSDLVLTTSRPLYESKLGYKPDATYYVPHGVQYDQFSAALSRDYSEAEDLRDIPHPRIGFFGLIHDWWDLDLLAEVAKRRPDWSFVFVGQANRDLSAYADICNMHFVGQRPHEALPGYCRSFDVGIIPHKISKLTINMNPIKLREYLAAGLPVVAAALPEVEAYEPDVRIAEGVEGWIAALEKAIAERRPDLDLQRSRKVSSESWTARVETILEALDQVAANKKQISANAREQR